MISRLGYCLFLVTFLTACATLDGGGASEEGHRQTSGLANGDSILNLYDAFGPSQDGLTHDFGFSALVRYRGKTILFDAGTNADILKSNAEALGVDLREVDFAVASHSHFDHINGFDYLLEVNPDVKIYFPADVFWGADLKFSVAGAEPDAATALERTQRYFDGEKEAFTFKQSGRFWKANVEFVPSHKEIAPGIILIATRSPFMGYFTRYPNIGGIEEMKGSGDGVKTLGLPELSMNLETPDGDVLMVGCSHSLVETIVRETKKHMKRNIGLVYGGYHLLPYKYDEIHPMAQRMKGELGVDHVAPAHCTGHAGFKTFMEEFGDKYHMAGLGTLTPFPGSGLGEARGGRSAYAALPIPEEKPSPHICFIDH